MELINGIYLYRLAPSSLGIYTPPFTGIRAVPVTASKALADTGARAVLDGPMFAFCGSLPREQCVQAVYLLHDIRRGVHVPSTRPDDGMTLVVTGGAVSVLNRAAMAGDVAVQLYPELIRGGRVVASRTRDPERVWRAALGWDGRSLVFAAGIAPMYEFATKLRAIGLVEAGYTDGGGSAKIATPSGRVGDHEDRPKAAWLIDGPSVSPLPPSSKNSWMVPAAVAAAVYWWLG